MRRVLITLLSCILVFSVLEAQELASEKEHVEQWLKKTENERAQRKQQALNVRAGRDRFDTRIKSSPIIWQSGCVGAVPEGILFSPGGDRIATAGEDGTARVWDAATGQQILVLEGHASDVKSAGFSPDGGQIVTAGADATARVWDAASGEQILILDGL